MKIENLYKPNPNFSTRYISPQVLHQYLQKNLSDRIREIGRSYLDHPIYMMSIGSGKTKILAWSQMHGNESNSTHAMLDLLEIFKSQQSASDELFSKISLDFIFMLNPDGSQNWTRRNALEIDLNRDFLKLSSKEFPLLKNIAENGNYHYAFNLHEQRTVFSSDGENPATMSFLAPAQNAERDVTLNRKKAMAVISRIVAGLQSFIPQNIARYNDEFYPTSTGDNFMKRGLPTILFEGGHFPNDYQRKETRKYYTYALYYGLVAVAELTGSTQLYEHYFDIPENKESHFDLIYRNVKLNTSFECVLDVAVQYREQYNEQLQNIDFLPIVVEVGDCGKRKGWQEIDCTGKKLVCENKYPKLEEPVDFHFIDDE